MMRFGVPRVLRACRQAGVAVVPCERRADANARRLVAGATTTIHLPVCLAVARHAGLPAPSMAPIGGARLVRAVSRLIDVLLTSPELPAIAKLELSAVILGGKATNVLATVDAAFTAKIVLSSLTKIHNVFLSRWAGAGMVEFMVLFHQHCPRDPSMYGIVVVHGEDDIEFRAADGQRLHAVLQGCRDVVKCLEQIAREHRDDMADYAECYCDAFRNKKPRTYADYIQLMTCQAIVDARLTSRDTSTLRPVEPLL